ncbi:MAG TPA: rhomboid family intramembrane serine protease [Elainellaceae cyanobacterium]
MDETLQFIIILGGIVVGAGLLYRFIERTEPNHVDQLEGLLIAILTVALMISVSIVIDLDWKSHIRTLRNLIIFAWAVHLLNWAVFRGNLSCSLGIHPRRASGLIGIIVSPFLHGWDANGDDNKDHLFGNTWAFIVLGWLILIQIGVENFIIVTIIIALVDGISIWLFAKSFTCHFGASGVTYGYRGFLLTFGVLAGSLVAYLFALLVAVGYGRQIRSLLPGKAEEGVSWEGHLFGFLGGVLAAVIFVEQPEFMQTLFNEQIPQWIWPDSMYIQ